jgi:hypothetical protein
LALALFYLAHELGAEAKGALDAAREPDEKRDPAHFALRGLALLFLARPADALSDLSQPALSASGETALVRSVALAGTGRFAEALGAYRKHANEIAGLPVELQRIVRMSALGAALESDAVEEANALLSAIEAQEPPGSIEPMLSVLAGRLAARQGRRGDALNFYTLAERSPHELAASEARLRRAELALSGAPHAAVR